MRRTLVTKGWLLLFALISSAGIANAQDAAQGRRGRRSTPRRNVRSATPSRVRVARRIHSTASGAKLSADDIRAWIVTRSRPAKAKSTKKPPMPAKYGRLPAADLDALVAYMQSLK